MWRIFVRQAQQLEVYMASLLLYSPRGPDLGSESVLEYDLRVASCALWIWVVSVFPVYSDCDATTCIETISPNW